MEVDGYVTAKEVEKRLDSELDFYIGKNGPSSTGNGGNDDSEGESRETRFVYLAQRDSPGFKD